MGSSTENKVMSAKEAVSRFVHDGEDLIIGNYTVGTCMQLIFEICRQGKKALPSIPSRASLMSIYWSMPAAWIASSAPMSCDRGGRRAGLPPPGLRRAGPGVGVRPVPRPAVLDEERRIDRLELLAGLLERGHRPEFQHPPDQGRRASPPPPGRPQSSASSRRST